MMGEKVVALHGGPTGEARPNEACIRTLEAFLEMARSGEIVGVTMAGLSADGCARYALGGVLGGYSIIGAIEMARTELIELARE